MEKFRDVALLLPMEAHNPLPIDTVSMTALVLMGVSQASRYIAVTGLTKVRPGARFTHKSPSHYERRGL